MAITAQQSSAELRARLVSAAKSYVGVPFVHAGRSRAGLDCVGLVVAAAKDCGLPVDADRPYSSVLVPGAVEAGLRLTCDLVGEDTAIRPADVLLFDMMGVRQHVAMVTSVARDTGDLHIVHAYQTVGRVAEHSLDAHWKSRVHSVWRLKELR